MTKEGTRKQGRNEGAKTRGMNGPQSINCQCNHVCVEDRTTCHLLMVVVMAIVRMRMTEQTAPLFLILRGMAGTLVVTAPRGRVENRIGGVLDVDVPVLLLLDCEELLAAGHGVTGRFTGLFVGRKDGERRLFEGGRQNDAAGVAWLGRSIGAGDAASGGEGGGNDQIDLVGMTGRRDTKTAEDDVRLAVLGLSGGSGDVGGPVDRDTGSPEMLKRIAIE